MAINNIALRVRVAWWFRYLYLPGLACTMALCEWLGLPAEPDWQKLDGVMQKAITFKTVTIKQGAANE